MKILKVLAVGVAIVGVGVTTTLTASAAEWNARTVDQIKADIAKTSGKEYTIVWGDTLSGISAATNITVDALAQRNNIENVDLIFAGNKLIFEGNVVTVQNPKGETVAQTVIKPEEKVDPAKKIGEAVDTSKDSKTDSDKKDTSTSNTGNSNTGGSTGSTGNSNTGGSTSNTGNSNTGGSTSNTGNSNTGGSTSNTGNSNTGGSTSNTGNSNTGGSTSNTGNSNTGGSTSNTGNSNTGGSSSNTQTPSTPSEKPSTPTEPSKPAEPTIVTGYIGNSGRVFDTGLEANTWANEILANDFSKNGYYLIGIFYSDGTEKYSIDWY